MKVICVQDGVTQEVPSGEYAPLMPNIPVGSICTVMDESEYKGKKFYLLEEYFNPKYHWWYTASIFIPLSNIDETEMSNYKYKKTKQ